MRQFLFFSLLTFIITFSANASSTPKALLDNPNTYPVEPTAVYTPQGFDSNDNVEVFFEGQFPNSCYKIGTTVHTIDKVEKKIFITDLAHYFGQDFCSSIVIPYQKGINAGLLPTGEYRVYFKDSKNQYVEKAFLPVAKAKKNSMDDYLYAPIRSIQYIPGEDLKGGSLRVSGQYPTACMEIDDVKLVYRPGSNVIDVLPISDLKTGACEQIDIAPHFEQMIDMSDVKPGRWLLHVRALNGQSVNEIVTIKK